MIKTNYQKLERKKWFFSKIAGLVICFFGMIFSFLIAVINKGGVGAGVGNFLITAYFVYLVRKFSRLD